MVTQIIGTSTPQQTHFPPKKTSAAFRLGPIQRKDLSEPVKELRFGPWPHGALSQHRMAREGHLFSLWSPLRWGAERFLVLLAALCGRIRRMGTPFSVSNGRQRCLSAQCDRTHQVVGYRKPQGDGPYLL